MAKVETINVETSTYDGWVECSNLNSLGDLRFRSNENKPKPTNGEVWRKAIVIVMNPPVGEVK